MEKYKKLFVDQILNMEEIPEEIRGSELFPVRVSFFAGGFVNTYLEWIRGELDCPLDEISAELARQIALSFDGVQEEKE